jgi:hypothetical protein
VSAAARIALCVLAACGGARSHSAAQSDPDPVVDMQCVAQARAGKLGDQLPAEAAGFHVTPAKDGAHVHRDGRKLDEAAGKQLWDAFNADVWSGTGLSMASLGQYSVYTCADAGRSSCVKASIWVCQLSVAKLAERVQRTLDKIGLADAELTLDLTFVEARGPACRSGAECPPTPHYSTKNKGPYDPNRPRWPSGGRGVCENDGDCDGGGNSCEAWYLAGGAEIAIYVQHSEPTFCGCVRERCSWFTQ